MKMGKTVSCFNEIELEKMWLHHVSSPSSRSASNLVQKAPSSAPAKDRLDPCDQSDTLAKWSSSASSRAAKAQKSKTSKVQSSKADGPRSHCFMSPFFISSHVTTATHRENVHAQHTRTLQHKLPSLFSMPCSCNRASLYEPHAILAHLAQAHTVKALVNLARRKKVS